MVHKQLIRKHAPAEPKYLKTAYELAAIMYNNSFSSTVEACIESIGAKIKPATLEYFRKKDDRSIKKQKNQISSTERKRIQSAYMKELNAKNALIENEEDEEENSYKTKKQKKADRCGTKTENQN